MANPLETAKLLLKDTLAIRERSIQTATQLLEQTSVIRKKCEERYKETGVAYNVFKIAGISEREVPMCKVLTDLLNPKGFHYQGNVYLKLFMDMVVKPHSPMEKAGDLDLSKAKVNRQSSTNEGRLIDITVNDGKVFIPIEAKINAGEQPKQLSDYANESRKRNKAVGFIPVLFLTKDGHKSEQQVPKDDYVCISFEKDIISWLEACLEKTKEVEPVREVITQYIKAIKSFCGNMEDEEMEKKIQELIMSSDDNYEAALKIRDAVKELNCKSRAWEIFKNQILNLVTKKLSDTKYEEADDDWCFLEIMLGNGCKFQVNYDMKSLAIEAVKAKTVITDKATDKIREIMFEKTGVRDEEWGKRFIWASKNVKYRDDLEGYEGDMYMYKLYQIYKDDPQSVAGWIVSIAEELKKIKTANGD